MSGSSFFVLCLITALVATFNVVITFRLALAAWDDLRAVRHAKKNGGILLTAKANFRGQLCALIVQLLFLSVALNYLTYIDFNQTFSVPFRQRVSTLLLLEVVIGFASIMAMRYATDVRKYLR